jgi:hypothetical protein
MGARALFVDVIGLVVASLLPFELRWTATTGCA